MQPAVLPRRETELPFSLGGLTGNLALLVRGHMGVHEAPKVSFSRVAGSGQLRQTLWRGVLGESSITP